MYGLMTNRLFSSPLTSKPNHAEKAMSQNLYLLMAILVMMNGFAFLTFGQKGVMKLNLWLLRAARRGIGNFITFVGKVIRG